MIPPLHNGGTLDLQTSQLKYVNNMNAQNLISPLNANDQAQGRIKIADLNNCLDKIIQLH